jgi:hypothetical protein
MDIKNFLRERFKMNDTDRRSHRWTQNIFIKGLLMLLTSIVGALYSTSTDILKDFNSFKGSQEELNKMIVETSKELALVKLTLHDIDARSIRNETMSKITREIQLSRTNDVEFSKSLREGDREAIVKACKVILGDDCSEFSDNHNKQ